MPSCVWYCAEPLSKRKGGGAEGTEHTQEPSALVCSPLSAIRGGSGRAGG